MLRKLVPPFFVLLFSFFTIWSFITPGFIPSHDGEYHLVRLWQFDKMIHDGNLFPRWAPDLNFSLGLPLFDFFYPLPNYVGEIFHLLGCSYLDSIKLVLASGMLFSSLFFFFWTKSIFNTKAAIIGSIFYTLAPYHLIDLSVRGSPGEIWALAFIPAILFALEKNKIILGGFFIAGMILAHNILAVIFLPFILVYGLILKPKNNKSLMLSLIIGISLTASFWLPAIFETRYITGLNTVNYADHFPEIFQLIFPSWGSGFSIAGINDQMSFQIGIPHLLVVFGSIALIILGKKLPKKNYLIFFLFSFFLTLFLLLEISLPIWKLIPLMPFFQYPWRLLSLVIVVTSFLASYIIFHIKSKIIWLFLLFLVIFFYSSYALPVKYTAYRDDNFYLSNPDWIQSSATLGSNFSTIWLKGKQNKYNHKIEITKGKARIIEENLKLQKYSFLMKADTPSDIKINTTYFPGWQVRVNEDLVPVSFDNGLINFHIPKGKSTILVEYKDTPLRIIANLISIFCLISVIIVMMIGPNKRPKN